MPQTEVLASDFSPSGLIHWSEHAKHARVLFSRSRTIFWRSSCSARVNEQLGRSDAFWGAGRFMASEPSASRGETIRHIERRGCLGASCAGL